MPETSYYSVRNGIRSKHEFDFPGLKRVFLAIYVSLEERGFFQEAFGYINVINGRLVPGNLGSDIEGFFYKELHRDKVWPIKSHLAGFSESDFFDVVELLFTLISAPLGKGVSMLGPTIYSQFSSIIGQEEYRKKLNEILNNYDGGYELSETGEIYKKGEKDLDAIFQAPIPTDDEQVSQLIQHAISKYRNRHSTHLERKEAIVQLGNVLEPMRYKVKSVLKKDENDLFEILNKFGLRHHKSDQKTDYDSKIFDSWLFYHYLAAVHAYLRLLKREQE